MAKKKARKKKKVTSRKRSVSKKKPVRSKARKARKPVTKRRKKRKISLQSLTSIRSKRPKKKKGGFVMARKKGSRRSGKTRARFNVGSMAMNSVGVLGGAIGGAVVSNIIPIPDKRIKAAISVGLGLLLGSSNLIKGEIGKMIALGMVAGGGLSFARQALPSVPMIAGETEEELLLGYDAEDELSGLDDTLEMEGEEEQSNAMEGEEDIFQGESINLSGDTLELMGAKTKREKWISD